MAGTSQSVTPLPMLTNGTFELRFANGVSVVAHARCCVSGEPDRAWFSRLYVQHHCVAGADGGSLRDALLGIKDEVRDALGFEPAEFAE